MHKNKWFENTYFMISWYCIETKATISLNSCSTQSPHGQRQLHLNHAASRGSRFLLWLVCIIRDSCILIILEQCISNKKKGFLGNVNLFFIYRYALSIFFVSTLCQNRWMRLFTGVWARGLSETIQYGNLFSSCTRALMLKFKENMTLIGLRSNYCLVLNRRWTLVYWMKVVCWTLSSTQNSCMLFGKKGHRYRWNFF